jgi:hypothetical protein
MVVLNKNADYMKDFNAEPHESIMIELFQNIAREIEHHYDAVENSSQMCDQMLAQLVQLRAEVGEGIDVLNVPLNTTETLLQAWRTKLTKMEKQRLMMVKEFWTQYLGMEKMHKMVKEGGLFNYAADVDGNLRAYADEGEIFSEKFRFLPNGTDLQTEFPKIFAHIALEMKTVTESKQARPRHRHQSMSEDNQEQAISNMLGYASVRAGSDRLLGHPRSAFGRLRHR